MLEIISPLNPNAQARAALYPPPQVPVVHARQRDTAVSPGEEVRAGIARVISLAGLNRDRPSKSGDQVQGLNLRLPPCECKNDALPPVAAE
jgi:hypothetical protein